jgi:hypothetical protein
MYSIKEDGNPLRLSWEVNTLNSISRECKLIQIIKLYVTLLAPYFLTLSDFNSIDAVITVFIEYILIYLNLEIGRLLSSMWPRYFTQLKLIQL